MVNVNVYGTDWCEDTHHTRQHLDQMRVAYQYINIEDDAAAADWVREQNDGKQKTPTVNVDGLVLAVPSNGQLDTALRRQGLI